MTASGLPSPHPSLTATPLPGLPPSTVQMPPSLTLPDVDRQLTGLATLFGLFAGCTPVLAVLMQQPFLIGLAAPFIVVLIAGLVLSKDDADVAVAFGIEHSTAVVGDVIDLMVELRSDQGVAQAEVELEVPYQMRPLGTLRAVVTLEPGVARRFSFPVELIDWGVASPETLTVRTTDRFSLLSKVYRFKVHASVRVGFRDAQMRSVLDPDRFRRFVGSHLSNDRGSGIEIADIRPYQPGDPLKALNWRISSRRQEPWITLRHPDRSSTLVVVVDAHSAVGPPGLDTRTRTARAAIAFSRTHLNVHDRVGLLISGDVDRWIAPQLGADQMHRIADSLIDVAPNQDSDRHHVRIDPNKLIPLDAVVVVVSPLLSSQFVRLIADLRSRGRSVSVLQPLPVLDSSMVDSEDAGHFDLAARIHRLEEQATRSYLQDRGIPVMGWEAHQSVEVAMEGLRKLKRARRGLSAGSQR